MRVLNPVIDDLSNLYRPDVPDYQKFANREEAFYRVYDESSSLHDRVKATYYKMHTQQTVSFVEKMHKEWLGLTHEKLSIMETLELLNGLLDESDPDADFPNSIHAFQTAERIRELYPDLEWLQVVGLIHDCGKVLAIHGVPQWAVVGDTFVVGCAPSDKCVFGVESFARNPDVTDERYSSELGQYEPHCGLDQLTFSWGHDEYLYQVLMGNTCHLPDIALKVIRYHSFYPWHTGGAYNHLSNEDDGEIKHWVNIFNKFDLYSKSEKVPDVEAIKPYYQELLEKYLPGKLNW